MPKWSLIGAWVLVTVLATTLTWQIVSAADEHVSDRPVAALKVEAPLTVASSSTTSQERPSVTSSTGSSTPSSQAASSSTTGTKPSGTSSSTSTTATSTTVAETWKSKTVSTGGGVVVVSYRNGEVVLSTATPAAGFAAEIKKSGPPEVEVEFQSESAKFEVKARWSDGELKVETDSEAEGEED